MRSWVDALVAAGVVPASYIPEASLGRPDEDVVPAELVEGDTLGAYPLPDVGITPSSVCFLDGIQQPQAGDLGDFSQGGGQLLLAAVR